MPPPLLGFSMMDFCWEGANGLDWLALVVLGLFVLLGYSLASLPGGGQIEKLEIPIQSMYFGWHLTSWNERKVKLERRSSIIIPSVYTIQWLVTAFAEPTCLNFQKLIKVNLSNYVNDSFLSPLSKNLPTPFREKRIIKPKVKSGILNAQQS